MLQTTSQNPSSSICASDTITIDEKNAVMMFKKNVNGIQRDQYQSDECKRKSGEKSGYHVRIQGDKSDLEGKQKCKSVCPNLRVSVSFFTKATNHNC